MAEAISGINVQTQGAKKLVKDEDLTKNMVTQTMGWVNGFNTNQLGGLLNGSMNNSPATASTAYAG